MPFAIVAAAALTVFLPAAKSQSPPKRLQNPPLKEVPIDLNLPAPEKPDPVVFFEAPDLFGNAPIEIVTGLLRRKLYRQGVLIAAPTNLASRFATARFASCLPTSCL